ncbi:MAG: LytTR family DNA-binding domain-containing protein [Methylococcaceae bacterium]
MVKKWRVVLIEDELQARAYLKNTLLTRYNDIEVIAEATTVQQALAIFTTIKNIDGAFIDINLESDGNRAGLDLAFNINQRDNAPWIIFTTAYDYAVTAIEYVRPIGYLLKPLDNNRLDAALNYMRKVYGKNSSLLSDTCNESSIEIRHTLINSYGDKEKCKCFIKPAEILYVRKNSSASSVRIRLINGNILDHIAGTLAEWHERLNQSYFIKIHKSYFINLKQAQSIHLHPFQKETYQLSFKSCSEYLTIGEVFYANLVDKLQSGDY